MLTYRLIILALILCGSLFCVDYPLAAQENSTDQNVSNSSASFDIPGTFSKVSFTLVDKDGNPVLWPRRNGLARIPEQLRLTTKLVTFGASDTIESLLESEGIDPDIEAITLVYRLNPTIRDLSEVREHERLRMPNIVLGRGASADIASGDILEVTVDPEMKEQMGTLTRRASSLYSSFANIDQSEFQNTTVRITSKASAADIVATLNFIWLGVLRRDGRPITVEALHQINADASAFDSILGNALISRSTFTTSSAGKLSTIEHDLDIKKRAYVSVAAGEIAPDWPEVSVSVRALRNGKSLDNLRVYYVPEALVDVPGEAERFSNLTTAKGATEMLPEADYYFWVVREPSGSVVASRTLWKIRVPPSVRSIELTVRE